MPDGDYSNSGAAWLLNGTWKQFQPDSFGQALQGSKTQIGVVTTALILNRYNPALKLVQVAGTVSTANVPANMLSAGTIIADGYNVIQLDANDGNAEHKQVIVISNSIANGATTIKLQDFRPNFAYPSGTLIYYLTGTSWVAEAVAWAKRLQGRWIRGTIFVGNLAPLWAKRTQAANAPKLTDGITPAIPRYEIDAATAGTFGLVGEHWNASSPYGLAVQDFFAKLGALYGNEPTFQAVDCSLGGTIFMEPTIRHVAKSGAAGSINGPGVASMGAAGYTHAADIAALGTYMDSLQTAFPLTAKSHAYNPFGRVLQHFGPFPTTGFVGTPVTEIDFTGNIGSTPGTWTTANSAVLLHYYHGKISFSRTNPAGATTFFDDAESAGALAAVQTLLGGTPLWAQIGGVAYSISAINALTGLITLTTSLDASNTIDGSLQGVDYYITHTAAMPQYAVSAATNAGAGVTITGGPNPQPPAGAYVQIMQTNNSDSTVTDTLMTTARTKMPNCVLGYNALPPETNLFNPGAISTVLTQLLAHGPPWYYQTKADGNMNQAYLGLNRTMMMCIGAALGLGARWVEMPKGYIAEQDFFISGLKTNASTGNILSINGTTNWGGSNRWSGGPGSYGRVYFANGRLYYVAASAASTLTLFAATVYDAATQASKALGTAIALNDNLVTNGVTIAAGGFGIAVPANGLILLVNNATGDTQVLTANPGEISTATLIRISGMPQGSGALANAAYPTTGLGTTVYFCPLAAAEQAANLGQTAPTNVLLQSWDYVSPLEMKVIAASFGTSPQPLPAGRFPAQSRTSVP